MPRIFVAYRPGPDQPAARRLYRIFAKRFGSDNVEQASSIPAGRDVRVAAEEEVSTADVLLVIIGRGLRRSFRCIRTAFVWRLAYAKRARRMAKAAQ